MIALPLLGVVKAQGMTSAQLADEIADEFKRKQLLRDPRVSVEVSQYRPTFILGEVKNPGQYPYEPGMTMLTAVSVAGASRIAGSRITDRLSAWRTAVHRKESLTGKASCNPVTS